MNKAAWNNNAAPFTYIANTINQRRFTVSFLTTISFCFLVKWMEKVIVSFKENGAWETKIPCEGLDSKLLQRKAQDHILSVVLKVDSLYFQFHTEQSSWFT